jgi:hypothetical protein
MKDKDKLKIYEDFLHKINLFRLSGNSVGIGELIDNADNWSWSHRVGNGAIEEDVMTANVERLTRVLTDTPKADEATRLRQEQYMKNKDQPCKFKG